MTDETRRRLLDTLGGLIIGGLLTGSASMFVVVRRIDRLEAALAERQIGQNARDSEQERRLNNIETMIYIRKGGSQ